MRATHDNSIQAYREEAEARRLSRREAEIVEIVKQLGQGTDRQILAASKYGDMNGVRPRISELVKCGVLVEVDNIQDETTGKRVRIIRIAGRTPGNPTAAARQAARRQEQLGNAATGSTPAPGVASEPAICVRCAGAGITRVDELPDRYEWCHIATGESCDAAEKLRATNPRMVELSNTAALKTYRLSSPAPGARY